MQNYYNQTGFINSIVAFDIALETYISNLFFNGDLSRILYASNGYAFRRRTELLKKQSLDLPFYNYRLNDVSVDTDRPWFSHPANVGGIFIPQLQRKLKIQPITLSYEATLYLHTELDAHMAVYRASWYAGNETLLRPIVEVQTQTGPVEVEMTAVVDDRSITRYNADYDENDWLERNRIRTLGMDFEVQLFFIDEDFNFGIPKKVLFEFSNRKGWEYGDEPDKIYQAVIDHINGTVGEFEEQSTL